MKQLFEIRYGLKVMVGGTPTCVGCFGSKLRMFRYQICVNKITISRISWIWYFHGYVLPSQLEVGGPPKYHQEYMLSDLLSLIRSLVKQIPRKELDWVGG